MLYNQKHNHKKSLKLKHHTQVVGRSRCLIDSSIYLIKINKKLYCTAAMLLVNGVSPSSPEQCFTNCGPWISNIKTWELIKMQILGLCFRPTTLETGYGSQQSVFLTNPPRNSDAFLSLRTSTLGHMF